MILVYNEIGAAVFFFPVAVIAIVSVYLPQGTEWMLLVFSGTATVLWDLIYRIVRSGGHWWVPTMGGHLFFIPVWLIGVGELWLYIHIALQKGQWFPSASLPNT